MRSRFGQTRVACRAPVIAALLDDAFARLGLLDPSATSATPSPAIRATFADCLVRSERTIDRHVWLDDDADLIAPHPPDVRIALAKRTKRRIHTSFELSTRNRAHLERVLLGRLWLLT